MIYGVCYLQSTYLEAISISDGPVHGHTFQFELLFYLDDRDEDDRDRDVDDRDEDDRDEDDRDVDDRDEDDRDVDDKDV